jgi:hypothetical protein
VGYEWIKPKSSWFVYLLTASVLLATAMAADARQIWLIPTDPVWRGLRQWQPNDYLDLFNDESPWENSASAIGAFEVSKRFVLQADDTMLEKVVRGLQRRRIALGVQITALRAPAECGRAVEGYGPADDALAVAQRLKQFDADLRYVVLDEPLYYGHLFNGVKGHPPCRMPIRDIAAQAATKMAQLKYVFPEVQIGDVEPFGIPNVEPQRWAADVKEWLQEYSAANGVPLSFFRADIVWTHPSWRTQFIEVMKVLHSAGVARGVIYNGPSESPTDKGWTDDALAHAKTIECGLAVKPDQVIFQSWVDRPRQMLPETRSGTFTNMVYQYLHNQLCG